MFYVCVLLFYCAVQRLERWTVNRENPGSNHLAVVSKLWQFCSPHVASVHSAVSMSTRLQTEVDM